MGADSSFVKKLPTKADIRSDLEKEMMHFLDRGGRVEKVPQGVSGREGDRSMMLPSRSLFIEPSLERTPIPEVVAAIEKRRKSMLKRTAPVKHSRLSKRRQKTIYDDFGEPLRRVWVDD